MIIVCGHIAKWHYMQAAARLPPLGCHAHITIENDSWCELLIHTTKPFFKDCELFIYNGLILGNRAYIYEICIYI